MTPYTGFQQQSNFKYPLAARLLMFLAVFAITFFVVSAFNGVLHNIEMNERTRILLISSLQSVLVFIVPSVVAACLEFSKPLNVLTLDRSPRMINIVSVVICFVIGIAFLNQIIYWNESISLPSSMSDLENTLRELETNSRNLSDTILADTSVGGLISGILIVGCLTGFAEEMFFRAGLQRMLSQGMSNHAAIWIAAFIFSFMHFQFYGFIPRMLLGAFFGYLFVWSGTIWTSAFAHAFNNSVVVISAWLSAKGMIPQNVELLGVNESGFPWIPLLSGIILIFFITRFNKWFKPNA